MSKRLEYEPNLNVKNNYKWLASKQKLITEPAS